ARLRPVQAQWSPSATDGRSRVTIDTHVAVRLLLLARHHDPGVRSGDNYQTERECHLQICPIGKAYRLAAIRENTPAILSWSMRPIIPGQICHLPLPGDRESNPQIDRG